MILPYYKLHNYKYFSVSHNKVLKIEFSGFSRISVYKVFYVFVMKLQTYNYQVKIKETLDLAANILLQNYQQIFNIM